MGVNGKLLEFVGTVKNTAANKLNSNLATYGKVKNPEQYEFEQARYGGNLKGYQSDETAADTKNSDKGTVTNNYYYGPGQQGQQDSSKVSDEYTNDVDYLYGRRRPYSDFNIKGRGMAGNYRSTSWLKDEYGMEKLREMGLTGFDQTKGGLFRRPTQRYYFGQQGQQPQGFVPGQVDEQGMPIANQKTPGANKTEVTRNNKTLDNSQQGPGRPRRNFFGRPDESSRWNPENTSFTGDGKLEPRSFTYGESRFDTEGYADFNRNPDFRNWKATQKLNKLGQRLDRNYQREEGLNEMYNTRMSDRSERLRNRDTRRYNKIANKFGRDEYVSPQFADPGDIKYAQGGSYNAGDVVDMTPEELQRFIEMGGQVEFLD
jgi:hypothetical protein